MKKKTSWEKVEPWYSTLVGEEGHYYHRKIVIPGVLRLLQLKETSSLLDFGCGQGVLPRALQKPLPYCGVDLSSSLIKEARKLTKGSHATFIVSDICKPIPELKNQQFSHGAIVLALQNVEFPQEALQILSHHIQDKGTLVVVLNHPCFRIPRQSHWGIDEKTNTQYRRVDRYMSPLKIPIQMHPGKSDAPSTWSFHHPLSAYSQWLSDAGFCITAMEEWISDKVSEGGEAKRENRARQEFPLFLALKCIKHSK